MQAKKLPLRIFFSLLVVLLSAHTPSADEVAQTKAAIRVVGHQLLMSAGDSTSRVLPITKIGEKYRLLFERELWFNPEELTTAFEEAIKHSALPKHYLIEVLDCVNNQTVYSYALASEKEQTIVPCKGRIQPKGCYVVYFSFLQAPKPTVVNSLIEKKPQKNQVMVYALLTLPVVLLGFYGFKRITDKQLTKKQCADVHVGRYLFNPANMTLTFKDEAVELSGKESELLMLLHSAVNETLEREHILNKVWGDEGAYEGRTLDVFISKLRKRLAEDENIKIINVRGVGYKLVVD